ncbi:MAG: hypothetical protein V3W44_07325 [Dehalococcoidales bacterium]
MSKNEVAGRTVWVTRNSIYRDFEIYSHRPRWSVLRERWENDAECMLTSVCQELFYKWLGVHPTERLLPGGSRAIQRATLYVGLDWEGLR